MAEKEKADMHAELVKSFERIGEHSDWINIGDTAFSGQRRFLRKTAIGDNLITDFVQFTPSPNPKYLSARLECIVEDKDGVTLSGRASSFHTNQSHPQDDEIRSGKSGLNEDRYTWNNKNNKTALGNARKMVRRVISS